MKGRLFILFYFHSFTISKRQLAMFSACGSDVNPQWKMDNDLWQNELPRPQDDHVRLPEPYNPRCYRGPRTAPPLPLSVATGGTPAGLHPSWMLGSDIKGNGKACTEICQANMPLSYLTSAQAGTCAESGNFFVAHRHAGPGGLTSRPTNAHENNAMREGSGEPFKRFMAPKPLVEAALLTGNARDTSCNPPPRYMFQGGCTVGKPSIPEVGSMRGYPILSKDFASVRLQYH